MQLPPVIGILLVDDHPAIHEGLNTLIGRQQDMHVVANAMSGQEGIDLFRRHRPDVTLMDVRMPGMTGVEATRLICNEFPSAVILILSTDFDEEVNTAALQAGAKGYLLKDASRRELLSAIRDASLRAPQTASARG